MATILWRAVLDARPCPVDEAETGGWSSSVRTLHDGDGRIRIRIPIELGLQTSVGSMIGFEQDGAAPAPLSASAAVSRGPIIVEKVIVDQTNYDKRKGYDPKFLGKAFEVPLPKVTKNKSSLLKVAGDSELRYWTYSVLFHKTRRLAYVSAANVDPARWRGNRDADGDTWYTDSRFGDDLQIGAPFYKKQKTFEADRSKNPFDQGHLTRRSDVQWGDTEALAKRNGDDSYHYTNCAPQHWAFNQNSKISGIWFRLEEHAASANGKQRLSIFNGPIFNAPLCVSNGAARLKLNPSGKRLKDGTFGAVQIPRQFFKVLAYRAGDQLKAAGFIVTQEELLATIDRYYPAEAKKKASLSDDEIRLYQVPVATIEKLTGIDFGILADDDIDHIGHESVDSRLEGAIEEASQLKF